MSSGRKIKRGGRTDEPEGRGRGDRKREHGPGQSEQGDGYGHQHDYEHGHDRDHGHDHAHGSDPEHAGRKGGRGFFPLHDGSPAENAMGALMMTAKMIHRFGESRIAQNKKYSKLSGPRMGVLFIVHHMGGIRMGDLASKLHVAPRTVTDLVDGLERDGYLHRVPDPKDRRASILELSEFAKKDFERISAMRKAFVEEIFSPLSNEDKETLISLLGKLREGPIRDLLNACSDSEAAESDK